MKEYSTISRYDLLEALEALKEDGKAVTIDDIIDCVKAQDESLPVMLRPIPIPELEGRYYVSCYGNVYAAVQLERRENGVLAWRQFKELNQITSSGYALVHINTGAFSKTLPVHRLVATAFVPNPDPERFTVVNHKDEDKLHNEWCNLEWTDIQGNNAYGTARERTEYALAVTRRAKAARKTKNPPRPKKRKKVKKRPRIIATNLETNEQRRFKNIAEASRMLEIATSQISRVVNGLMGQTNGWKFEKEKRNKDDSIDQAKADIAEYNNDIDELEAQDEGNVYIYED